MTTAERRAAQRRLAKQIHTGTYQPSAIGAKSRALANTYLKEQLVDQIHAIKKAAFDTRIRWDGQSSYGWAKWSNWNEAKAKQNIRVNFTTGKPRDKEELKIALAAITEWNATGRPDDWDGIITLFEGNDESVFYYHSS